MSSATLLTLVDAQAASRQTIADKVLAYLWALWSGFDGWYKPSLVDEVSTQAWAAVSAGQAATAAVTDDYLARTSSVMRGTSVAPVGVRPELRESLRRGVTGPEVQGRVAQEMRWQVWREETPDVALRKAMLRARSSLSEDMALAVQRQAANFAEVRKVRTFMRVTRGENTCGLCAAASNQFYYRSDLMPIHANCRCTVIEVSPQTARNQRRDGVSGKDADGDYMSLSDADYERLTGLSRSLYGRDLKDVRYVLDEHGELGPVLRNATQREKTVKRLPDGSYETTSGHKRRSGSGSRKDDVPIPRKDERTPEQKKRDAEADIAALPADKLRHTRDIYVKSLAWAEKVDLPQKEFLHHRIALIDKRLSVEE